MKSDSSKKNKIKSKQLVAWIGIILLLSLYIITLFVAIFDHSSGGRWFMMCAIATVAIPSLIWVYTWLYGKITGRHTIADVDLGKTGVNAPTKEK